MTTASIFGGKSIDTKWLPPMQRALSVRMYAIIPPAFVYCPLAKNHQFERITINNLATLTSCTAEVLNPLVFKLSLISPHS
jgi:hypothetical protein